MPDGSGGAYAAWAEYGSIYEDIYVQRVTADGAIAEGWPLGGRPACRADFSQDQVALASDGAGGVFVAWQDFRDLRSADIYLQRIRPDGELASDWPADGRCVVQGDGDQSSPALVEDGAGGVILVWQDRHDHHSRVRVLALDASGTPRTAWPPSGVDLEVGAQLDDGVTIRRIETGHILAVWRRKDSLAGPSIVARSVDPATPPDSTASATPLVVASAGESLSEPVLEVDSDGYFVAWARRSASSVRAEVQRVSSGQVVMPQWLTPAIVSPMGASMSSPTLASDGSGGTFVFWEGVQSGEQVGILAQRIAANGEIGSGWDEHGVGISAAEGYAFGPVAKTDGSGGAIATWSTADSLLVSGLLAASPAHSIRPLRVREAIATPGRARLAWQTFDLLHGDLAIERQVEGTSWERLAEVVVADSGVIRYQDDSAPEGTQAHYRVVVRRAEAATYFTPVELWIPVAPRILELQWARYEPADRTLVLGFILPRGPDPVIEILDVSGRRVHREIFGGLETGEHRRTLALPTRMASGMYFLRVIQGSQTRTLKLPVAR